jgi:hypothetical protein
MTLTLAELKLALTAAGLVLLLGGVFVWLIYDSLQEREKRKRREDYNWRFNLEYAESLTRKGVALDRCRNRLDGILDRLAEVQSDEYWQERCELRQEERLNALQNNRYARTKLDGYYCDIERR